MAQAEGTRCPSCAFFNERDATASDMSDGPIYCNACGRVYGAGGSDPQRLLESSRVVWRRDWDAVAVGFVLGIVAEFAAGLLRQAWSAVW